MTPHQPAFEPGQQATTTAGDTGPRHTTTPAPARPPGRRAVPRAAPQAVRQPAMHPARPGLPVVLLRHLRRRPRRPAGNRAYPPRSSPEPLTPPPGKEAARYPRRHHRRARRRQAPAARTSPEGLAPPGTATGSASPTSPTSPPAGRSSARCGSPPSPAATGYSSGHGPPGTPTTRHPSSTRTWPAHSGSTTATAPRPGRPRRRHSRPRAPRRMGTRPATRPAGMNTEPRQKMHAVLTYVADRPGCQGPGSARRRRKLRLSPPGNPPQIRTRNTSTPGSALPAVPGRSRAASRQGRPLERRHPNEPAFPRRIHKIHVLHISDGISLRPLTVALVATL